MSNFIIKIFRKFEILSIQIRNLKKVLINNYKEI